MPKQMMERQPRCPYCGEILFAEDQSFGDLVFQVEKYYGIYFVLYKGRVQPFTNPEANFLMLLAQAKLRFLSREFVVDSLYYKNSENLKRRSRILDVLISKIRAKIKRLDLPMTIETSWGRGWRLVIENPKSKPLSFASDEIDARH